MVMAGVVDEDEDNLAEEAIFSVIIEKNSGTKSTNARQNRRMSRRMPTLLRRFKRIITCLWLNLMRKLHPIMFGSLIADARITC